MFMLRHYVRDLEWAMNVDLEKKQINLCNKYPKLITKAIQNIHKKSIFTNIIMIFLFGFILKNL